MDFHQVNVDSTNKRTGLKSEAERKLGFSQKKKKNKWFRRIKEKTHEESLQ